MAETWQVPGYVSLARSVASILAAPNDSTVRAILALWQCEQPNPAPWPPVHNNPGNLTRAIGSLGGPPPPVARTPPGVGLLYVYPTPTAGADAFAHYLRNSARYVTALVDARAGRGLAFALAVCAAGYGTRGSCVASLYPAAHLPNVPLPVHNWRAIADHVRVRARPSITGRITGEVRTRQVVAGVAVAGGPYPVAGGHDRTWIEESPGRFVAAAFFRRVS